MSHRKTPERRQNRITKDIVVVPKSDRDVPAPPETLPAELKARWYRLWNSDLGSAWNPDTDLATLERMFSLYKLRADALAAIDRDGVVVRGSKGQPVDHPMTRRMKDLDTEIRQLEDRMGLNLRARSAIGLQMTEATRSLRQLSAGMNPYDADDDGDEKKKLEAV